MPKRLLYLIPLHLVLFVGYSAGQRESASNAQHLHEERLVQPDQQTVAHPDTALARAKQGYAMALSQGDTEKQMDYGIQLGLIHYNQNRFNEALDNFQMTLNLARESKNPFWEAMALNRLGNVYQLKTNFVQARNHYMEALQINRTHSNRPEEARTLVNLANVYSVIGQFQRSIELLLEAMSIHESVGNQEGLAWTSLSIARLFKRLNLLPRAMQYAETALDSYRQIEIETGSSTGVTLSLNEIGSIYQRMGNLNKAKDYIHKVLVINSRNGNVHGKAANHLNLGHVFLEEGRYAFARTHLLNALTLKESVSDSIDLTRLYRYLGEAEIALGNVRQGFQYLNRSLELAQKQNLLPEVSESFLSLSKAYTSAGQYRQALDAFAHHSSFKDSLNLTEISRLEMQYEFEKREKEQELITLQREALQEARMERQRVVLIFFVIAFLLAGSLAGFIFYGYREKKRINTLLVEQNVEITKQKVEIQSQKEEIEQQRDYVTRQRDQIIDQQRLITDSITYASRIQKAVLPSARALGELPWESFVFYKPKNIVSGDLYWVDTLKNGKILVTVADCTGHGVPGAFMSMLGITLIREVAENFYDLSPAEMLGKLRSMVMSALNLNLGESGQSDGMDMSLVMINPKELTLEFAGAYLPLLIARKGSVNINPASSNPRVKQWNGYTLTEYRGDKMPIGSYIGEFLPFTNHSVTLAPNDTLYMFSDGCIDQFGGPKGQKFLLQNLKELLFSIQNLPLMEQKEKISSTIQEYQGTQKQVDDMIVMGIKV